MAFCRFIAGASPLFSATLRRCRSPRIRGFTLLPLLVLQRPAPFPSSRERTRHALSIYCRHHLPAFAPSTTDGSDLATLQRVGGDLPKAARVLHFRSPDFGAAAEEAFLGPPNVRGHSGSRLCAVRKLDFGSAPVERGTDQGQPLRKGLQFGCTSSARVPGKRRQTLLLGSQDAPDFIGRTLRTASLLETSLQTPWRE